MKVIFLDIDGVLNNDDSLAKHAKDFNAGVDKTWPPPLYQPAANNLVKLLKATGAKIVISSTWRIVCKWTEIKKTFKAAGIPWDRVIGQTPAKLSSARGSEIGWWLRDHGSKVKHFVILDDDSYDMGKMLPKLVQTDHKKGLTEEDVEKAIKMLEDEE